MVIACKSVQQEKTAESCLYAVPVGHAI